MTAAHHIAALPVVLPLLTAAALVIASAAPRRVHDAVAIVAAAATTTLCAILLVDARRGPIVEWLGGWRPHHGVAIGIALTIDRLGAGMATLAAALVTAALLFAAVYFEEISNLFHALILAFLAALTGFCLSGDLFNMVVFFVLMGVAAYGLTAFEIGQRGTIQGGINFAVTNSIAGFAALFGVALVYGRSGALNLAQIGLSLGHRGDALVAVAFALIGVAFMTKAAIAPFHFWLPDAHAVAPAPVSAVFSGVMAEAGVFGLARLLATAFAGPLGPANAVRAILVALGVASAVVGAVSCVEQRHLKRMLGFATVAHVGVILCGVALLDDRALAGAALYAVAFGLAVAALFMAVGVLATRERTVDEYDLHGTGRRTPAAGALFGLGALVLAGAPLTTSYFGAALIDDGARRLGYGWLPFVLAGAWALTAAALLRAGGRVFLGWGAREPGPLRGGRERAEDSDQEQTGAEEGSGSITRTAPVAALVVMPALLALVSIALGLIPGAVPSVVRAAAQFRDHAANATAVLGIGHASFRSATSGHVSGEAIALALGSTLAALALAALALFGRRLVERLPRATVDAPLAAVHALRAAHSGRVGDYVAWWTFGLALVGGALLWTIAV